MHEKIIGEGLTFDDLLLVPQRSDILPADVDTRTHLTRDIALNIPIVSSPMDTVTEHRLAVALAQEGGMGIIHKNLSIEDQSREVSKVKRSESGIIHDPKCLRPEDTIGAAKKMMQEYNISGIPIIQGAKLVGILTIRDLRFQSENERKISEVMTRTNLITAPVGTTLEEAKQILYRDKVEKLLLIDKDYNLKGLITIKDINKMLQYPNASKDKRGRLLVGASIGVFDYDRAAALIENDVDVVVVDTAHGHSSNVITTVKELKKRFAVQVIAGNVATSEGARDLVAAGADAIKVGMGPGSICTTRIVAGVGVPQLTAIMQCTQETVPNRIPVIADGGTRHSGDITKALAAGASTVMIGGLLAGTTESPGEIILYKGRSYKSYRGMGSLAAMARGSRDRYRQEGQVDSSKLVPEGVEGMIPYKGSLADLVYQLVGGVRSGMGYCGAKTIPDLQAKAKFIRITQASLKESHPHDVIITKESPNYSDEQ